MYKSPIELLVTDIQNQIVKQQDEEIYKAVVSYVPNVDKEELIRALKYDRDQYEAGYLEGEADAMASIVCCKDCKKHGNDEECPLLSMMQYTDEADFCSYGERKDKE